MKITKALLSKPSADTRPAFRVYVCATPGLPIEYCAQRLTGFLVGGYYESLGTFETRAEAEAVVGRAASASEPRHSPSAGHERARGTSGVQSHADDHAA